VTYSEKQRRLCTLWAFTIGILIGHYLYATGRWTYTYYESRVWFESAAAQQMRDTLDEQGLDNSMCSYAEGKWSCYYHQDEEYVP